MNWDELREVWSAQPEPGRTERNAAELERAFGERQRKLARALFWRDVREAAAGLFVAGVMARVGWQMGPAGWPIAAAVALVLGVSVFFVAERLRVRRQRVAVDAPLLMRLDAEIAEQRRQRDLLSSVGRWYLGPIVLAGAIFVGTVFAHAPLPRLASALAVAFTAVIFAGCGWLVLAVNRRAVRQVIEPRLRELEELREGWGNSS